VSAGFGMAKRGLPVDTWTDRLDDWLVARKITTRWPLISSLSFRWSGAIRFKAGQKPFECVASYSKRPRNNWISS